MTRAHVDNPDECQAGRSGPELIKIDEIIELDNPKVTMPQVESPGDVSYNPEIARTSGREGTPNPLHDLITIYDDEESSEVSVVTLVQITEENDPEKASSLALDALIQGFPQNDQEVESVLDTEIFNVPETQMDSPTDEPRSGEQKEEVP